MKLSYSGKTALIIGGSSDLALNLAVLMIESELHPTLSYRSNSGSNKIAKRLAAYSGKFDTCFLDFSDPNSLEQVDALFENRLDYFIDFAQGHFEHLIASADSNEASSFFDENISVRAHLLKKVARIMLKNKSGRMLFISSGAAKMPNSGQGFYAASKLASEALYRNIGIELGSRGITTVSLRPGYVEAGRGTRYLSHHKTEILKKIPVRKVLTPREVAESIMFFLSDSARGFNATEIVMDGGLTSGK